MTEMPVFSTMTEDRFLLIKPTSQSTISSLGTVLFQFWMYEQLQMKYINEKNQYKCKHHI